MKYAIFNLQLLISLHFTVYSNASIWTPSIISDNMVLQKNDTVKIWGWSTVPDETITINCSWLETPISTKVHQGNWKILVTTTNSKKKQTITVSGHEQLVIENILFGEVWLASGQSNMEWNGNLGYDDSEEERKTANYPEIRFFKIKNQQSKYPLNDVKGEWVVCSPKTVNDFSAVGYLFGKEIHKKLKGPVGLIQAAWGGTPIEPWIEASLTLNNEYLLAESKKLPEEVYAPEKPGVLFNSMIFPLKGFRFRGIIWYQGESNVLNAESYYKSFPLLIKSWRQHFGGDLPFYFVQIAPFTYWDPKQRSEIIRDAQLFAMKNIPNTGMVVTNDIGDLKDIHPRNKKEVARRLSLWAISKTYGFKDVVPSGPVYHSANVTGNKIIVQFKFAEEGLIAKGEKLMGFEIAGADKKYYPARAKIKKNEILLCSPKVRAPQFIRYAYSNIAEASLFNTYGLPASAFKTE